MRQVASATRLMASVYNSEMLWLNCCSGMIWFCSPQSRTTDIIMETLLSVNCCSHVKASSVCHLSVCTAFRLYILK